MEFDRFDDNVNLCVYRSLNDYIEWTKSIRGEEKNLFISAIKPNHIVTKSTVSRWLKEVIRDSGIEISHFQGHSTRSASTSKALLNGASIEEIMKAAHWSKESTFKKLYNNSESIIRNPFQNAVLKSFKPR